MILKKLLYFFQKAFKSIRSNLWINLITVGTIGIALVIFGAFMMLVDNLHDLMERWGKNIQVIIYLDRTVSPERIGQIQRALIRMKEVRTVSYVSKEEAMSRLQQELMGHAGILEGLSINPLPSSFEIHLKEGFRQESPIQALIAKLRELDGVEDIQYGQEWIERFSQIFSFIKISGLILGGCLILAVLFIISNTIKLALYARKEEVEILKLVGATNGFIFAPFLFEGLIQGLVGATLSILLLFIAFHSFFTSIDTGLGLSVIRLHVSFLSAQRIVGILILGMGLGLFGSLISLGRFMR